jgi:formylglycine-generating enzyme required for sulfatase activity
LHRPRDVRSHNFGPLALTTLLLVACDSVELDASRLRPRYANGVDSSRDGDECAPGNAPNVDDAPDANCAEKFDPVLPSLIDGEDVAARAPTVTLGTSPQNLRPLAADGTDRPSCQGKTGPGITTCGPNKDENCCRSLEVPGGKAGSLEVRTFDLGVYEVTVGRFEVFVETFGGDLRGAAKSGAIPGISAEHAAKLPPDRETVDLTMGDQCQARSDVGNYGARTWPSKKVLQTVKRLMSDDNDRAADIRADARPDRLRAKPVNCVTYWMAEAFCKWDGGRLPTNDEWRYAAIGGDELRPYPWSGKRTPNKLVTHFKMDGASFTYPEDFPYFDNGMNAYHIAPPGQKPAGAARWGHMDMAGNVLEFMADETSPGKGILRGGSWEGHDDANSVANVNYPFDRTYGSAGFRCAYGEAPPPPEKLDVYPTVPVFRAYNAKKGDHLMGIVRDDIGPNYVDEGRQFFIFDTPPQDSAPLVRCAKDGFNYLSNDPSCGGDKSKGQIGFVSTKKFDGGYELVRCRDPKGNDRISTTKPSECKKRGYVEEGFQGFVAVGNAPQR